MIVEVNNGSQKEDQMLKPVTLHFCLCQCMSAQLIINYSYIDRGISYSPIRSVIFISSISLNQLFTLTQTTFGDCNVYIFKHAVTLQLDDKMHSDLDSERFRWL